jgi:hypothetical protein
MPAVQGGSAGTEGAAREGGSGAASHFAVQVALPQVGRDGRRRHDAARTIAADALRSPALHCPPRRRYNVGRAIRRAATMLLPT